MNPKQEIQYTGTSIWLPATHEAVAWIPATFFAWPWWTHNNCLQYIYNIYIYIHTHCKGKNGHECQRMTWMSMNDLFRLPDILCFHKMLWQLQGTAQPYQIDDYIDGNLACCAGNWFSSKHLVACAMLCFSLARFWIPSCMWYVYLHAYIMFWRIW